MNRLEAKIGYTFKNKQLLITALTHSSYANEHHGDVQSYERLEFLGDSILGLVTADFLYHHEPKLPEGRMTRLRAELVCETSLHSVALELGLGEYMRLGRGEEHTGGRTRASILADMVESVIAAMYIDSGSIDESRRFVIERILSHAELDEKHRSADYKTRLQELVQKNADGRVSYELIGETGPDHCKTFSYRVYVNGEPAGEGSGRTKKEAEQMAAGCALEALNA